MTVLVRIRKTGRRRNDRTRFACSIGLLPAIVAILYFLVGRQFAVWETTTTATTTSVHQQYKKGTKENSPSAELAFSKLELFLSAFPGKIDPKDDEGIDGFTELKETFIRSLQFFWPRDQWKLTAVLDDTTFSNEQERNRLVSNFTSFFAADHLAGAVNVTFNPRTNSTLYGTGWFIQQLIMLWADNFTQAEYIGFVDDDTIFSSLVRPSDLFDPKGRPRVIANLPQDGPKAWSEATAFTFQRTPSVYTMTYFPLIIKREHLKEMRQAIMKLHPEYSCFDDFFTALIHRGGGSNNDKSELAELSQFCLIMDYVFQAHRDEYHWHFETNKPPVGSSITEEMLEPLPRVSIHASYLFIHVPRLRYSKTVAGRRQTVSDIMKEGYCYSLPAWNATDLSTRRCAPYHVDDNVYHRGQWKFEQYLSAWAKSNATNVALVHAKRMSQNIEHSWDETELKILFGT